MSVYTQTIQGVYIPLTSAIRTATQIIVGRTLIEPQVNTVFASGINPEIGGIIAHLNVTAAPGVETLQLVLEEQDPASNVWSAVLATLVTTATGMVKLKVSPAITAVAPSITIAQAQDTMPAIWRLRVVHSAAANWTYSLGVVLYN